MKKGPPRVMIVETAGRGKLCHYTYSLCTALSLYGVDVTLVTSKEYELDALPKNFRIIKIFPQNRLLYPFYFPLFFSRFRKIRPSVLHLQWLPSPILGFLFILAMKVLSPVKMVYTPHNILPHRKRFFFVRAWAQIYREVDMIIAHSRYNRAVVSDLFDIDPDRIAIIPDFLYFDHITKDLDKEGARKKLGLADGKIILFFGYINRRKGVDLLIRALKGVRKEVDASLVIAGKPEEDFSPYGSLIEDLELERHVLTDLRYIPFERMLNYFAAADVIAIPYLKVCSSPIIQLARSFKKPVITTEVSGIEGRGIMIVEPDTSALEKALVSALKDQGGNEEGHHPRWEEIASLTVDVYNKVLQPMERRGGSR